ncbi:MAG: divergent polysaccharide deacetylase family protein [Litoreibacter sp.]
MLRGFLSGLLWGTMMGALVLAVLSLYATLPGGEEEFSLQVPGAETEVPAAQDTAETTQAVTPNLDEETANSALSQDAADAEDGTPETADVTPSQPEPSVPVEDTSEGEDVKKNSETGEDVAPVIDSNVTIPEEPQALGDAENQLPQVAATDFATPALPNAIPMTQPIPTDTPPAKVVTPQAVNELVAISEIETPLSDAAPAASENTVEIVQAETVIPTLEQPKQMTEPTLKEIVPQPVVSPDLARNSIDVPIETVTNVEQDNVSRFEVSAANTPLGVATGVLPTIVERNGTNVVTGRLPSISDQGQDVETSESEETNLESVEPDIALVVNAQPFAVEGKSLFSIVIIDAGDDGVSRDQILNSTYPVTVAIDPAAPGAASLEEQYRTAGIEVVALLNDLPKNAEPTDVDVALSGYFDTLIKSVAVMDPLDARLQSDRELLEPVLGAIKSTGHGLMTYAQGLNSAQQAARRYGVPSASVYRVLDSEQEDASKIKRYLERAAFNANKDGSVVVVGHSYPETMKTILEWALEANDDTMSLAPLSAILKSVLADNS